MKHLVRLFLALSLGLMLFGTASAHAKLIKASPAPNSVLATAPTQVQLWFDEALDLNFSEVQVIGADRQRIDQGTLGPVPGDPKSVIVPLKPAADGNYSVIWSVLSATDGHVTRGVFAFGIGSAAGPAAPVDTGAAAPAELSPVSAAVRWLSLLSLLTIVGAFVFRFFLLERSLDAVSADAATRAVALRRWRQLVTFALVLFLASNAAELAVQTSLVTGQVSPGAMLAFLRGSRSGALWLLRLGLIAACAILLALDARGLRVPFADSALIVLGNVALFTRSLGSHAAAAGNFSLPVFADWLHLLGVAVWVGGLFSFAWLMPFVWRALETRARSAWIAWLVPQFSYIALPTTVVIAVTGFINSVQQVPALDIVATGAIPTVGQLTQSTYNDALLIKVLLFAIMIAFGALNFLWISPRFRRYVAVSEQSAGLFSRFRLTVGAEVLLGLGAVLLAGILTLSVPPRSEPDQIAPAVVQEQPDRPVMLAGNPSADVKVQLEIGPTPTAPSQFTARVTSLADQPIPNLQRVIFNFMYLNDDTGVQNVNAEPRGPDLYAVDGSYLSLEGMWKIKVTVRRSGVDDVASDFPYYIAPRFPDNNPTPVVDAQLALQRAQQNMNGLTALRSTQELNDGSNGVVVSDYEYRAPDRTRFVIQGQGESIAIGSDQYYQDKDGGWIERGRVENFLFPNFDFARTAQATRFGRTDKLNGQNAQLILFNTPTTSGSELIHYAYWVGETDKRVLQFAMVTTGHYMIQSYRDFDSPDITIAAPANVKPADTPAPVSASSGSSGPTGAGPLNSAVAGVARPRGFITGDLEGDGALVLVVAGVVVLLVGTGGKRPRNARLVTLGLGAAAVLLGVGLFVDAVNGTTAAALNVPVNADRASSGRQVYDQYCAACHGPQGYGDGPGGASLPVKPFDLTTHVLLHDEQYLHATILNGRGYMPAFGSKLSQDQILDVIAYTRLLARQAQQNNTRPGFTPQP